MSLGRGLLDGGSRAGLLPIEAALQNIASAAHSRGVVTTRADRPVGEVAAGRLMATLRGAWRAMRDDEQRRRRVERVIRHVAGGLWIEGPVRIPSALLAICASYARQSKGQS